MFVDSAEQLRLIINHSRVHSARGIPNDAMFFLEDFLLAMPDAVAGAHVLIATSGDFLESTLSRCSHELRNLWVFFDRVVISYASMRGWILLLLGLNAAALQFEIRRLRRGWMLSW